MKQAPFDFKGYRIDKFTFDNKNEHKNDISIKIDPRGTFILNENIFILQFEFYAFDKEKTHDDAFVECFLTATFKFNEDLNNVDEIPDYFYTNSIAIVFPYLRSFITSLTMQANVNPVILPTMNLSSLSIPLKENITVS